MGESCRTSGPSLRDPRRNEIEIATISTSGNMKEIYLKIQDSLIIVNLSLNIWVIKKLASRHVAGIGITVAVGDS